MLSYCSWELHPEDVFVYHCPVGGERQICTTDSSVVTWCYCVIVLYVMSWSDSFIVRLLSGDIGDTGLDAQWAYQAPSRPSKFKSALEGDENLSRALICK